MFYSQTMERVQKYMSFSCVSWPVYKYHDVEVALPVRIPLHLSATVDRHVNGMDNFNGQSLNHAMPMP